MIKIVSGWTNAGGSTIAFINLVNEFNKSGYDACLYGPHTWHLDKCRSEQTRGKIKLNHDDILIVHFINKIQKRPDIKKFIFSCHEQDIFPLKEIKYNIFDKIHFVSEHQKNYHNINYPFFIIPNILDDLKPNNNLIDKIGGIVGSIDKNKQVHISIEKALQEGCQKVYIYGLITDTLYWQNMVKPLVDGNIVIYKGYEENKQKMYDSFSDLYFSSIRECAPYVIGEAKMTKKKIHIIEGKNYLNIKYEYDKKKIIEKWINELSL